MNNVNSAHDAIARDRPRYKGNALTRWLIGRTAATAAETGPATPASVESLRAQNAAASAAAHDLVAGGRDADGRPRELERHPGLDLILGRQARRQALASAGRAPSPHAPSPPPPRAEAPRPPSADGEDLLRSR